MKCYLGYLRYYLRYLKSWGSLTLKGSWNWNWKIWKLDVRVSPQGKSFPKFKKKKQTNKQKSTVCSVRTRGQSRVDLSKPALSSGNNQCGWLKHVTLLHLIILSVAHIYPHNPRWQDVRPMNYNHCCSHFGQCNLLWREHRIWQSCSLSTHSTMAKFTFKKWKGGSGNLFTLKCLGSMVLSQVPLQHWLNVH